MQWNINGIRGKKEKLQELIEELGPKIIVLQEIKIIDEQPININNYEIFRKGRTNHGGGLCTAVHKSIPSQKIVFDSHLEILVCKVFFKNTNINICNVYFPSNVPIDTKELDRIIKEIPYPRLILGDINSKHASWGSDISDSRGSLINDWIIDNNLYILNDGTPTRYDKYNDKYSNIDISLIDIQQSSKFLWNIKTERAISDHFPIILDSELEELYTSKNPRWKIENADWREYREKVELPTDFTNPDLDCDRITNILIENSERCIPRTSSVINLKYSNCWWTPDCKIASDAAKKQFTKLQRNSNPINVDLYNQLEATSTQVLLDAKRNSWGKYVGSIKSTAKIKEIWTKVNAISGKKKCQNKIMIKENNDIHSDPNIVSNKLGEFYSYVNSDENYPQDFIEMKNNAENNTIVFPKAKTIYNRIFTIYELEFTLDQCTGSSPGPDDLHYEMFKQLTTEQKSCILKFINYIWTNDVFPEKWHEATIIPILKPNKVPTQCTSYRPISLTSCFCKIVEKLVNKRLVTYLESKNIIKPYQSGARKFHSTYDALIRFESAIRETLLESEILVAVFFDIEKAYDLLWKHAVIKILKDIGLKGHLPNFIKNFLADRKIKVRIGNIFSESYNLENGTPQGSILSPIIFILLINTMFNNTPGTEKCLFMDDGLLWAKGNNIVEIMEKVQNALDRIETWGKENGIKFSTGKTKYMIFTRKQKQNLVDINGEEIKLKFYNNNLERVFKYKYLGMIFDPTLTWGLHINDLVVKCQKPLNILQAVAHKNWGSDRKTLLNLYTAIILSKINYGSFRIWISCRNVPK